MDSHKKLKSLNGQLFSLVEKFYWLKELVANEILASESRSTALNLSIKISKIIKDARESGYNWLWAEEDISYDEEYEDFSLPSVDLCYLLGLENNNKIENFLKSKNYNDENFILDTESGAWYPKFKTREAALNMITYMNSWLDDMLK